MRKNDFNARNLSASVSNQKMTNRLFKFSLNFHPRLLRVNEPIQRMGHRAFQRIFNWHNAIISFLAFYQMEHIIDSRSV